MQTRRRAAVAIALLVGGLGASARAKDWDVCPDPKSPLSQVTNDVDREVPKPMTEDNATAQLKVASAFVPQPGAVGGHWCVRYEVINDGPAPVPLLDWPDAGLKIRDDLPPDHMPQGYTLTLGSMDPPTLKPTEIYGFKGQTIRTRAFQVSATTPRASLLRLVATPEEIVKSAVLLSGMGGLKPILIMDDQSSQPEVGGEFTGAGADVGVKSIVSSDGKNYSITVLLGRNNKESVESIMAPFTLALDTVDDPRLTSRMMSAIKEFKFKSLKLPMDYDLFKVRREFEISSTPKIYLIRQPITFKRPGKSGSVCFLVPTYSPIKIPEGDLSCD
jgi:hypothetical protein